MRAAVRATQVPIGSVMLGAALAGRALDVLGLLPGVTETTAVRGGAAAWLTCACAASLLAGLTGRCWSRTASLPRTASLVVAGQLLVFLSAEAVVRLTAGQGPFEGDGLGGGLLQSLVALLLLVALTVAGGVVARTTPLTPAPVPRRVGAALLPGSPTSGRSAHIRLIARGPPPAT